MTAGQARSAAAHQLRGTCRQISDRIGGAVRKPVVVYGGRTEVGVSVGVVATAGPCRTAEHLLRTADRAMYRHKNARPSRGR